jgi:hypothetical protein
MTINSPELQADIVNLYAVFSVYPKISVGPIGCIDYGGTEEEQILFSSTPLKEIPEDYIRRLEFYDPTWDSWGNENEVKYLLPRILECIAINPENIEDAGIFSLFKYKMSDLYKEKGSKWAQNESRVIKDYLFHLFEHVAHNHTNINLILELLCSVSADMEAYFLIWQKLPTDLKAVQIENWVLEYLDLASFTIKNKGYCDNLHGLEQILSWVTNDENVLNSKLLSETQLLYGDLWWKLITKKK